MRAAGRLVIVFAAAATVAAVAAPLRAQRPGAGQVETGALNLSDGSTISFGLFVPRDYDASRARPLVLALHPGGERSSDYGPRFLDAIVQPGVETLGAIAIAPNCPPEADSWVDPRAERAVMALVEQVRREFSIDPARVAVVGFSMGGRGAWVLPSRHPAVFTAAIAMAAGPGNEPLAALAHVPTYVIHSRDDEVVPFERTQQAMRELERLKRPVEFRALSGFGHFEMTEYVEPLQRAADWIDDAWTQAARSQNPSPNRRAPIPQP